MHAERIRERARIRIEVTWKSVECGLNGIGASELNLARVEQVMTWELVVSRNFNTLIIKLTNKER
jgi:hypothetical protein